jgi:hypothetical protein
MAARAAKLPIVELKVGHVADQVTEKHNPDIPKGQLMYGPLQHKEVQRSYPRLAKG